MLGSQLAPMFCSLQLVSMLAMDHFDREPYRATYPVLLTYEMDSVE